MSEFQVLLVSIDWDCPNKIRAIIPSKSSLKYTKLDENRYEYDIVLYNKEDGLYFQFAIKTKYMPFLKTSEGKWNKDNRLHNIQDDFWIIKGDWRTGQREKSYHHCPSINTIGKIEIGISEDLQKIQHFITIDINSNIDDFDFNQLKNDFEGELWNLITSNKSSVSVEKVETEYGDKIFRYAENQSIIKFIKAFDRIEKNPKRQLSEIKELRRVEKVIPIVETYRKLSRGGGAKLLPSKSFLEDYDIYENRFVCFMLYGIHSIVFKNIKYTTLEIGKLQNEIKNLIDKIATLQAPDPLVDSEKIKVEISLQEEFLEDWKVNWEKRKIKFLNKHNNTAANFNEIVFQVSGVRYFDGTPTFWGNKLNGNDTGWSALEFEIDPGELFENGKEITVRFFAAYKKKEIIVGGKPRNKFSVWSIRQGSFEYVSSFKDKIIQRQRTNYTILQNNNWRQYSIFSLADRNKFNLERSNQVQTLNQKIRKIKFKIQNISGFNEEQSKLLPLLEKRIKTRFFEKTKWKHFQGFKPSMTYVQNINYRNALGCYKEILKSEGINLEVFDQYEKVTTFGLREMPQVYELWCLIIQIKVLEESFHFEHFPNDLLALLKNIEPNKQIIAEHSKIGFKNKLAGREVTLHYQKKVDGNKRPDFILEVTYDKHTINLVLDSKFKNYSYKKSIVHEMVEMNKKYSGNENYVFILHPCKDGIFENKNVKYTNHGGERVFYGEGDERQITFPFHEYGYLELKPNITDTLKKLIAMSFEYLLEPSRNAKKNDKEINPRPDNEMFCLSCGGTNISINESLRGDNRHYFSCTCNEVDCGHQIYIDYCWNCKTKLFKHGSYWDYHLESTWSIFDIHCPCCGMTMADRPQLVDY